MMFKRFLLVVFVRVIIIHADTQTATHWMVTEEGLIQPRVESPFLMERPYDLIAFLNQDSKWNNIINWYHELAKQEKVIEALWTDLEKNSDITTHLNMEEKCRKIVQLSTLNWYSFVFEDGKVKEVPDQDFLVEKSTQSLKKIPPDCKKLSSLMFSMFTFEHLEGIRYRENLTAEPELSLPDAVKSTMTIDQFGNWLASVLKTNTSSWLHYNMAGLFWRAKGDAPRALECSRRAVHYAPRYYKDIALVNYGIVLHRSKRSEDAITVLEAAIDHDPTQYINHFVLASAHAVVGNFNRAIKHFNECLKIIPECEIAAKHKLGVLCHESISEKIGKVRESLNNLRKELREYVEKETMWINTQTEFLKAMKHTDDFDINDKSKYSLKISQLTGLNITEQKPFGNKATIFDYYLNPPLYNDKWEQARGVFAIDSAVYVRSVVKTLENNKNHDASHLEIIKKLKGNSIKDKFEEFKQDSVVIDLVEVNDKLSHPEQIGVNDKKSTGDEEGVLYEFDKTDVLYPPTMKISRNKEDFDRDPEWPSDKLCKEASNDGPKNLNAIYPVFLPFENKGIRIGRILSDKIGVPLHVEHALPWHPPRCGGADERGAQQRKKIKQQTTVEVIETGYLREKLLEYVGDGDSSAASHMQDAEIGQRIYAAMQMEVGPRWVVWSLAALYWLAVGGRAGRAHAAPCAARAARAAPAALRDVPLTALASAHLQLGHFHDALAAAEGAFRISLYEPTTNFILAQVNMVKQHRSTQLFHLKQVERVEPGFQRGAARRLLVAWACELKLHQEIDILNSDICKNMDPSLSMVCDKDGSNCQFTQLHCYHKDDSEAGTIFRMIESKSPKKRGWSIEPDVLHEISAQAQAQGGARGPHERQFARMLALLRQAQEQCGPSGCAALQAAESPVEAHECRHQLLQLGYWLHVVSIEQLHADSNLKIISEVNAMVPSDKKVPECRLPVDYEEDFFFKRMSKVDLEGWQTLNSLKHQLAELYSTLDYELLGSKLAKYLEIKPGAWRGLVAAGWWCGASGRARCALRCLRAAHARAPRRPHAARALAALTHMQSKQRDAKDIAYLGLYTSPKSKIEAFIVALSHAYLEEFNEALWMFRYALALDDTYLPVKACLHATLCLLMYSETAKSDPSDE